MPSMCVRGKSASWHLEEIMAPLARIKARDRRPKIWLVTSPSSTPLSFIQSVLCFDIHVLSTVRSF